MGIIEAFIIIGVAALIHASFQLGVSMLTLLSSHTIGKKRSHTRLLGFISSFVSGAITMTILLVSFSALILLNILQTYPGPRMAIWTFVCGLLLGVGIAVWIWYYRRTDGTALWLPRGLARHLNDRVKATRHNAEAFSLGLVSGIAELLFTIAPIAVAAMVLAQLDSHLQLLGLVFYTLVASLSLLIVAGLVGGGHSLGRIQKWREQHKRFLQFIAGSGLIALGFYLYVNQITAAAVGLGM
jgi:hypothetical protein